MATIRVYPYLSPRLIEVLAPDTEISIQELVNLVRDWEDEDDNMSYDFLISAAGKESLGGGVTVGITATLNNAQVFFSPRSVPRDNGIGRTCDATDTLGRQLYVDDADFIADGVQRGDLVYNVTTQSSAAVLEVVDQYTINHLQLSGGSSSEWTAGDEYIVFENVQCNISGGNLVANDEFGSEINSTFNSFGTQIIRTASSSATLQELEAIQFSSFEGGITIDVDNLTGLAVSGTTYPTGTRLQPSNNLVDADFISDSRGIETFYVIGNLTLTNVEDWNRHLFVGESANKSMITLEASANITNCEFKEFTVTGTLDGSSLIERCVLKDLDYVDGFVFQCSFAPNSTITLNPSSIANMLQCFSGQPGTLTPVIDCGGTGIISLRDYNGGIKITNYNGVSAHSIDLSSGQVILDSNTITSGVFVVRGVGKLIDELGNNIPTGTWNGGVTIVNELLTASEIGTGSSVWTALQRDEVLQYSRKASDNAEQANLKL